MTFTAMIEDESQTLFKLDNIANAISVARESIATEGMTRNQAVALETYSPGILGEGVRINGFTMNPSTTRQCFALEAIDAKRASIIGLAIIAVGSIIFKFFSWLSDKFGTRVAAGSAVTKDVDKINTEYEKAAEEYEQKEKPPKEDKPSPSDKYVSRCSREGKSPVNNVVAEVAKMIAYKQVSEKDALRATTSYEMMLKSSKLKISDKDTDKLLLLQTMTTNQSCKISAVLSLLEECGHRGAGGFDGRDIYVINTLFTSIDLILKKAANLLNAISKGSDDAMAAAILELETEVKNYLNKLGDNTHSKLLGKTGEVASIEPEDGYVPIATTYRVRVPNNVEEFIATVQELKGQRLSTWASGGLHGDDVVLPDKYPQVFETLATSNGRTALADWQQTMSGSSSSGVASLIEVSKGFSEEQKRLDKMKKELTDENGPAHRMIEFSSSAGRSRTKPVQSLNRALRVVSDSQTGLSKILTAYVTASDAIAAALKSVKPS